MSALPSASHTDVGPEPSVSCSVVVSMRPLPSGATVRFGRSPACGKPCGFSAPCCLFMGLKCSPALVKSGGSHLPTAWTCTPCGPGGRPLTSTTMRTTLPACAKRATPTVWPCGVFNSAMAGLSPPDVMTAQPASSSVSASARPVFIGEPPWRARLGCASSVPCSASGAVVGAMLADDLAGDALVVGHLRRGGERVHVVREQPQLLVLQNQGIRGHGGAVELRPEPAHDVARRRPHLERPARQVPGLGLEVLCRLAVSARLAPVGPVALRLRVEGAAAR